MALGRQNLYEDLSARKPANRLVQGNEFPDHEYLVVLFRRLSDKSLIFIDFLLRSGHLTGVFYVIENFVSIT